MLNNLKDNIYTEITRVISKEMFTVPYFLNITLQYEYLSEFLVCFKFHQNKKTTATTISTLIFKYIQKIYIINL